MIVRFLWRISVGCIVLLSIIFCHTIVPEGFVANTLVRIPNGYACIQDLRIKDEVLTCTFNDSSASEAITQITSHAVESIIRIDLDGDIIAMAEDQLLFVPLQQRWLPASHIHAGMYLRGAPLREVRVHSAEKIEQKTQLYALALNEHHNYLIGKHNIVVHNFGNAVFAAAGAAEGITFLNAFLAANPLVAPVTIAVGGAGLIGYLTWNAVSEIKESRKGKRDKSKNNVNASQPDGPKKSDEEDKNNNQNKDFLKNLKLRSDKRARTNRFGNLYRDSKTKLWWSKDLAGHGKSCYKVFKETAKGLEWIFDATAEGLEIVGKHKSPTGLFIPYKEVIF